MFTAPIEINGDDIVSQFDISETQLNSMFDNIAKSLAMIYVANLENEAASELHSTKRRYIQNIRVIDSGRLESTVMLDYSKDKLVQMIEEGASSFDMKEKLLASPKAKTGKDGKRYITVPLRWAATDSVGESELFSGKMPQEIYDIVRKKEVKKGISVSELPEKYRVNGTRPAISDSAGTVLFKEYQHKSSIYQGITKQKDTTTGQSTYFSFRRVSENSDDNAFIHPGIQGRGLMGKALSNLNIPQETSLLIDNELAKLGL